MSTYTAVHVVLSLIGIGSGFIVVCGLLTARRFDMLTGRWRRIYAGSAVVALYFNVFVLVVQTFLKVPALHEAAPTQTEPPFVLTQLVVLVIVVAIGVTGVIRFGKSALEPAAN